MKERKDSEEEKKTQKREWDRKREEDGQKNDQKCLKFKRDLAEGKRNVQHHTLRETWKKPKSQNCFKI